jgi:CBS domain containing-hemolysin-like protein
VTRTRPLGVVHVRDALSHPETVAAVHLMRPVLTLRTETPIYAALSTMRDTRNHLALVESDEELIGLITLHDLLDALLPSDARR